MRPNVFFNVAGGGNWTTEANGLGIEWNDPDAGSALKSVYDPCPPGWRMPADGTWNDMNLRTGDGDPITVRNSQRDLAWGYGRNIGTVGGQVGGLRYWPGATVTDRVDGRIWYPATGYRNSDTGAIYTVGSYGNYWSATAYSAAHGRYLYFGSTGVNPNTSNNRAYGFVARCLSE